MARHSETRFVPYKAEQMYNLVADVAKYPEFLPWCAAARIRDVVQGKEADVMEADLVISFKVFRERFGSRVTLWKDGRRIETEYIDGPFRRLESQWAFADAAGGCEVFFEVEFEFRNAVLQSLIGLVFNDAMQRIAGAFERRAAEVYA